MQFVYLFFIATTVAWGSNCNGTSVGFPPLSDPFAATYKGQQASLYPNGSNQRPPAHEALGIQQAAQIVPRDTSGNPDPNGRIVMISVGMSNTTEEFSTFIHDATLDSRRDTHVLPVDGAFSGWSANQIVANSAQYWSMVDTRLQSANVTRAQVQVAWVKLADPGPTAAFPSDAQLLESEEQTIILQASARFPNLKIIYFSSRIYAGYADSPLNPEPFAYQTGFAVKWLIEQQINGAPQLDVASGKAPWLAWGSYLWADGITLRFDGLTWNCSDLQSDGTHPSSTGAGKVSQMLLDFFHSDSSARTWYLAKQTTTAAPVINALLEAPPYSATPLPSGSVATILGTNLATGASQAPGFPLPHDIAGTRVDVDGVPALLQYVSPTQINFIVPPTIVQSVAVSRAGTSSSSVALSTALPAAGLFNLSNALPPVTVSGQVTVSGVGLAGVTVNLHGTQAGIASYASTTTDSSGRYSIPVSQTGTFVLSATRAGYSFSAPVTFSNPNANQISNFTGVAVAGLEFYPVTPCRLVDTRLGSFQSGFGTPSIQAGSTRSFVLPSNTACGIPSTAAAYSLNITAVTKGYLGLLTTWPTGQPLPNVSTLNSYATTSTAVSNAAIVPAGTGGAISVYASDATDLVIDINGYFAQPGTGSLQFYPVAPCRLVDTRVSSFPAGLGPPAMTASASRTFSIGPNQACGIPGTAAAYSLNVTAVPRKTLGFLSIWPAGKPLPNVSTLNVYNLGTVVANAAIIPAGAGGAINAYATDATDLIIDINGYFAQPASTGLKLYPMAPCRVADTRIDSNPSTLGSPSMTANSNRAFLVTASACDVPTGAGAYSLNFTAVPQAPQLGIFEVWPTGQSQPNVSTMNSYNGSVVANAAIVPAGNAGAISVGVTDSANVLFDINGYFAP